MPRVTNPGVGSGQVALNKAITTFSAADILALSTTPKVLVPAAGAGTIISVQSFALVFTVGTVTYNGSSGDQLDVFYSGGSIDLVDPSPLSGNIVTAVGYYANAGLSTGSTFITTSGIINTAVVLSGSNYNGGAVLTTSLGAGGLGYAVNDTGFINAGNTFCTYKVLTIGAGGAVLTYQIVTAGSQYLVANGVATGRSGAQPGVGNGLTINILTVQSGNGTMKTYTYYDILPAP